MSEAIQIESGIPIPPPRKTTKYPFRQMEVGDSFSVPTEGKPTKDIQRNLHKLAEYHKIRIRTRSRGDRVRVWLIEKEAA